MIDTYKSLLEEIEKHKLLLKSAKDSHNYYVRLMKPKDIGAMQYSDMPKGSKHQPDAIVELSELMRLEHMVDIENDILDKLEKNKQRIDDIVLNGTNLAEKVRLLRIQGLTQASIAEMLNISERWVQKLEKKEA